MKIFLDGQFVSEENAKISVFDHGLLYGDGVFEGIRLYNGKVFRLEEHLDRLFASAKSILLPIPMTKQELRDACCEACRVNNLQDGYLRLLVTRGIGNLGLNPFKCKNPIVIIIASTIELYPEEVYRNGLTVITASTVRTSAAAVSPSVKSLNYLNNILAKIEAVNAGCLEAVMLNSSGYVAECTGDNLFIARSGKLETPPVSAGALNGITRAVVIELASKLGMAIIESNLTRYDIMTADECFLTGTAAEIVPVTKIDQRVIGAGKPGELTLKMTAEFRKLVGTEGTSI